MCLGFHDIFYSMFSLLLSWHMHGLIPPANSNSLPATHWIPVNKQNDQNNISWGQLTYGSVSLSQGSHTPPTLNIERDTGYIIQWNFWCVSWYLRLDPYKLVLIKRVLWMFFGCFLATNQLHDISLHLLSFQAGVQKTTKKLPSHKTGLQALCKQLQWCQSIGHGYNPQRSCQLSNAQNAK